MVSPPDLTLLLKALLIFSEASLATNSSFVLYREVKSPIKIFPSPCSTYAGGLSLNVDEKFGFCQRASWNGENP